MLGVATVHRRWDGHHGGLGDLACSAVGALINSIVRIGMTFVSFSILAENVVFGPVAGTRGRLQLQFCKAIARLRSEGRSVPARSRRRPTSLTHRSWSYGTICAVVRPPRQPVRTARSLEVEAPAMSAARPARMHLVATRVLCRRCPTRPAAARPCSRRTSSFHRFIETSTGNGYVAQFLDILADGVRGSIFVSATRQRSDALSKATLGEHEAPCERSRLETTKRPAQPWPFISRNAVCREALVRDELGTRGRVHGRCGSRVSSVEAKNLGGRPRSSRDSFHRRGRSGMLPPSGVIGEPHAFWVKRPDPCFKEWRRPRVHHAIGDRRSRARGASPGSNAGFPARA